VTKGLDRGLNTARLQPRSKARARTRLLCAVAALGLTCAGLGAVSHAQQSTLPSGFSSLTLGMSWDDVQSSNELVELTRFTSEWERLVYECGYRRAQLTIDEGRLLVTAENFTITHLSFVTAIDKGSNLNQVAQLIIDSYGQPRQATMRDRLGAITFDQRAANYVTLKFSGESDVEFVVSGNPLWEYRISIEDGNARRAQNRTIRCARTKEKLLAKKAP